MNIAEDKIVDFSNKCLVKAGISKDDAALITDTMLIADYRKIHSHGFLRLPIYVKRIKKGFINKEANIDLIKDNISMSLVDADYAAGQVAGKFGMENSIKKAGESGIGLTVVKNSNHFGIAAYYSLLAAEQNMVGMVFSNVEPLMPAVGGAEKIIGNNPIAIAAPNKEGDPIVLDMALSNVPLGKVLVAKSNEKSIPDGWGVDKNGNKTNKPDDIIDGGFLLPMGGPKGFGLAFMTEILTGLISGGQFSKNIESMYDLKQKQSISYFMLAIDVTFFMDENEYFSRMCDLKSYVKDSHRATGVDELYVPGELEFNQERRNRDLGVPMEEKLRNELENLSKELQIEMNF